jgi:hypothetical protein
MASTSRNIGGDADENDVVQFNLAMVRMTCKT